MAQRCTADSAANASAQMGEPELHSGSIATVVSGNLPHKNVSGTFHITSSRTVKSLHIEFEVDDDAPKVHRIIDRHDDSHDDPGRSGDRHDGPKPPKAGGDGDARKSHKRVAAAAGIPRESDGRFKKMQVEDTSKKGSDSKAEPGAFPKNAPGSSVRTLQPQAHEDTDDLANLSLLVLGTGDSVPSSGDLDGEPLSGSHLQSACADGRCKNPYELAAEESFDAAQRPAALLQEPLRGPRRHWRLRSEVDDDSAAADSAAAGTAGTGIGAESVDFGGIGTVEYRQPEAEPVISEGPSLSEAIAGGPMASEPMASVIEATVNVGDNDTVLCNIGTSVLAAAALTEVAERQVPPLQEAAATVAGSLQPGADAAGGDLGKVARLREAVIHHDGSRPVIDVGSDTPPHLGDSDTLALLDFLD